MKYSPFNIKNQEFNKSVRGYDKDEVKAYLEKLSDEFELLQSDNKKLSEELEGVREEITEFKRIEKNLQSTLLNAQESSSKSVESAKKQTALILKEAELKAAQIVEKAKENANFIRDSVLQLREERDLLIARLKAMLSSQTSLLEMNVESIETHPSFKKSVQKEEKTDMDIDDIVEKLL